MWYERNVMYSVCIHTLLKVVKTQCDLSVLAVPLINVFFVLNWIGFF